MTNEQIIRSLQIAQGIQEPIHTYAGWKTRGRQVKRGSKAVASTQIWIDVTKPTDPERKWIMKKSYFFTLSQTE